MLPIYYNLFLSSMHRNSEGLYKYTVRDVTHGQKMTCQPAPKINNPVKIQPKKRCMRTNITYSLLMS